jgi:hypothetical protein
MLSVNISEKISTLFINRISVIEFTLSSLFHLLHFHSYLLLIFCNSITQVLLPLLINPLKKLWFLSYLTISLLMLCNSFSLYLCFFFYLLHINSRIDFREVELIMTCLVALE